MGDRGNIQITQSEDGPSIFFYTHWNGSAVKQLLAAGLKRAEDGDRLNDAEYATRIIFDSFTNGDTELTGYGISIGGPPDNEHEIPHVQWSNFGERPTVKCAGKTYTAIEFIKEFGT